MNAICVIIKILQAGYNTRGAGTCSHSPITILNS